MDNNAFLYAVNPRRPIKNLNADIPIIRTNKSFYLTKEEVEKCLPFASVYRRFGVDQLVKVTSSNLERLHNNKLYTEDEWNNIKEDKLGENRGKVEKPENTESNTTPVQVESKQAGETDAVPDETIDNETAIENKEVESETVATNIQADDTTQQNKDALNAVDGLTQHVLDTDNAVAEDTGIIDNADSSNISVNDNSHNYEKKKKHKH